MKIGKSTRLAFAAGIGVCTVLPAPALAQTSQPGGTSPFTNTSGGAIAARRPGTWVESGIATFNQRQTAALHQFGGATISQQQPPSFRDRVLPGLVQILLGAIQALANAIQAAVQAGTATTAATGA